MMDKEEIAAMTAEQRKNFIVQARVDAQLDDRYQQPTTTTRHRMLEEWSASIPIETKAQRDERRMQELEMEREADIVARRVENVEARRAERDHEIRVAKIYANANANANANGNGTALDVDWAEVFNSINNALSSLVDRVRELEARIIKVQSDNEAVARRLEISAIRADTSSQKLSSEWKSEITALKNDINFLRFRMDVVSAKKMPTETTSHVVVHQGS
jgi:hypothetical protein